MKKMVSKTVSLMLTLLLVVAIVPFAAFGVSAVNANTYAPTIYVEGVNTKDVLGNMGTPEQKIVFPPSMDEIKTAALNVDVFKNIGKFLLTMNWKYFGDALITPANSVLEPSACNADGTPKAGTGIDWDYATAAIRQDTNYRNIEYATFYYDWRIDPMEVARQLDVFIERVCAATNHDKINLVGFSMGSVIVMAYLEQFGYDRVDGLVFSAPAFNGTVTCGEPFNWMIDVNGLAVARFMDEMLGDDAQSQFIKALLNLLYKTKTIDAVNLFLDKFIEEQGERVYDELMLNTLATMPGLWSLIPDGLYEQARDELLAGDARFTELVKKIDNYHNNVQEKGDEIIAGLLESGAQFGIISKYGSQLTPCIDSWDAMGDSVIDTKSTSFGATCASLDGTLGGNYVQKVQCGHNHLSPDNQIDASTCKYPDYTWFVRELPHSHSCADYDKLVDYILYSNGQVTVRDNADYPQFMRYNPEDESVVPMTAANCGRPESLADYSLFRTIKDFGSALVAYLQSKNG